MISILIPSIGRPTLINSLNSLIQQSNPNWAAFVGFDGCAPKPPVKDDRITYFYLDKVGGGSNQGGMVRNALIQHVKTDWIGFVDDDDTLRAHYVDALIEESKANPDADCIVFRMSYHPSDQFLILPPLGTKSPEMCRVGISFAVKKEFLTKNKLGFINYSAEDFILLNTLERLGGKIFFSSLITYNVRF